MNIVHYATFGGSKFGKQCFFAVFRFFFIIIMKENIDIFWLGVGVFEELQYFGRRLFIRSRYKMGKCLGMLKFQIFFRCLIFLIARKKREYPPPPWGALLCDRNCVYDCGHAGGSDFRLFYGFKLKTYQLMRW